MPVRRTFASSSRARTSTSALFCPSTFTGAINGALIAHIKLPPFVVTLGMLSIARSLAMGPDVMLFDEVTAALDPETVKEVLVTIRQLAEEGMTCMLVTHEMGFAREIADHIYFTDHGRIVEHGPPAEFFQYAQDPRTKEFLSQIL